MQIKPTVIRLQENGTLENASLSQEQASALKEHFGTYVTVTKPWSGDGFNIAAGGYVGTLVLDDLRIHIDPKVPIDNLFFMLTYAYDLPAFREQTAPIGESEELFEFIVQIFVRQVDDLVRKGIHRGYLDEEEDRRFLRGRLLLGTHVRRNVVHAGRFHVRTNEFTADLLENRILKATLGQLSRIRLHTPKLSLQVRRTWSAFSEVSYAAVSASDCDRVLYNRLNERYRSPINLARLLLQHLSLEHHTGQTPFATFVLPMHDVFERFVSRFLAEALASRPRFAVTSQENFWLDMDRSLKGIPDIVLRYDGRPFMILDTKYKDFKGLPGNPDVFQMVTYGQTLKVDQGMLVYPNSTQVESQLDLANGMRLMVRSLPLDGPLSGFKARCRSFAQQFVDSVGSNLLVNLKF